MPRIQILSEETINQIAAGEVIESPSSVVKELIENAIDADAKKITIEISQGGLNLIRVIDDGIGMEKEDALLSIQRHATSKMQNPKDLFSLITMGFRGEALAAIGAVSKLVLTTATNGLGIKILIEAGVLKSERAVARVRGTTMEVKELFFNVPARKKFQKNPNVLSAEIFRLVTQFALGFPSIHFILISNRKTTLNALACSSFQERAENLIGVEFATKSFPIKYKEEELHLHGLLGTPLQARPNRLNQYLFLNRRLVYCELINLTIREAYGNRLEERRHPSYLLYIQLPTDLVDINVHPQKREVRLRDERLLRKRIVEAISSALTTSNGERRQFEFMPSSSPFIFSEVMPMFQENYSADQELPYSPMRQRTVGIFTHYLFLEGAASSPEFDGLLLVDLCLARFRIFYDQLLKRELEREKQGLLLPLTVHCTVIETAMLLTHLNEIESQGFSIRPVGKELFLVEAIPSFLSTIEVKPVLMELCELLQNFIGKSNIEQERREKLALVTARFARNKRNFTLEEAEELMNLLYASSDPRYSPQGDPISVSLSLNEIQNLFSH